MLLTTIKTNKFTMICTRRGQDRTGGRGGGQGERMLALMLNQKKNTEIEFKTIIKKTKKTEKKKLKKKKLKLIELVNGRGFWRLLGPRLEALQCVERRGAGTGQR